MEDYQYQKISKLEKNHWWFCGRRAIIKDTIIKYSKINNRILEVGSGTGGNYAKLYAKLYATCFQKNKRK